MQTIVHIDKSGRVVIPKEMRDELGFAPNVPLVVESSDQGLTLKPAITQGRMVDAGGGLMVYDPGVPVNIDIVDFIRRQREGEK